MTDDNNFVPMYVRCSRETAQVWEAIKQMDPPLAIVDIYERLRVDLPDLSEQSMRLAVWTLLGRGHLRRTIDVTVEWA